jgi:hypothetical protein
MATTQAEFTLTVKNGYGDAPPCIMLELTKNKTYLYLKTAS